MKNKAVRVSVGPVIKDESEEKNVSKKSKIRIKNGDNNSSTLSLKDKG